MRALTPGERVLRFEIVISGQAYRTLVARLRNSPPSTGANTKRSHREIRAVIDLCPRSKRVAVTGLGHHRLPKALGIRQGSPTYQHLAHAISQEISRDLSSTQAAYTHDIHATLLEHLQEIISRCPTVPDGAIRAEARDFELYEPPARSGPDSSAEPILARFAPTLLLDLDDSPTLVVKTPSLTDVPEVTAALREHFSDFVAPTPVVHGNTVTIELSLTLPKLPESCSLEFFLHWGSYEDLSPTWTDEPIAAVTSSGRVQEVTARFRAHVPHSGHYGATLYAKVNGSTERLWFGKPWFGDARFRIEYDEPLDTSNLAADRDMQRATAIARLRDAITTPALRTDLAAWLATHCPRISPGEILATILHQGGCEQRELSSLVSQLVDERHHDSCATLRASYGLGEIVFATPEASHAGAGGLAQVMSGLPIELSKSGVPITIITPLYRYQNGHKHPDAEEILKLGITLGSESVVPSYQTTISVHIGPTHYSGTCWVKRPATTATFKVYMAEVGRVRMFLLASTGIFDRLYQPVYSDEQLRRAIAFSRAILETIATESLGIRPSAIISNDWMTACVPAFAALDPAYQRVPWLRSAKTVHMIHNGGADYHGRLPVAVNGEDLWPMFNLAPEHYFGFKDPFRGDLLNVTMAAAQHINGGVITVSQPYAQQLTSANNGGDGLEFILQDKRNSVFGVSNGINREEIDTYLSLKTNLRKDQLEDVPLLLEAKARVKTDIQRRFGLRVSPDATLAAFVGRVAEQKGLSLLSGIVSGSAMSTLEHLLIRHPRLQILIAGPVTDGDPTATALCNCVHYLSRKYPGRIASEFNFIPHSTALAITTASTLFLMPSRFEPGGITQLEALAVGTLVVGRAVGGIAATISNFDPASSRGTGFLCHDYDPTAFANTTHWALSVCSDSSTYQSLVSQARQAQHSWADRAPAFAAVLQRLVLGDSRIDSLVALECQRKLSAAACAG